MRARKQPLWLPCTGKESWTKGTFAGHGDLLDLLLSFAALSHHLGKAMLKSVHSETGKQVEEENYSLALQNKACSLVQVFNGLYYSKILSTEQTSSFL